MTNRNETTPIRALFLSLSRMPPLLMLLIIMGLAIVITMAVMQARDVRGLNGAPTTNTDAEMPNQGNWDSIVQFHKGLQCSKCQGVMDAGSMTQRFSAATWQPGPGGLKQETQVEDVVTFRCKQCGYLESYSK